LAKAKKNAKGKKKGKKRGYGGKVDVTQHVVHQPLLARHG
jgi:hypothetical protein